jgi:hypothetical protein
MEQLDLLTRAHISFNSARVSLKNYYPSINTVFHFRNFK